MKIGFYIKSIALTIVVLMCIGYLGFIGIMEFLNVGNNADVGLRYWFTLALHLAIISICLLYLVNRVAYWYKNK